MKLVVGIVAACVASVALADHAPHHAPHHYAPPHYAYKVKEYHHFRKIQIS